MPEAGARSIESQVRTDSPLEGDGFEPSVPRRIFLAAPSILPIHRGALCEWGCLSSWIDPAADDVNIRWTRELAEVMRPFTTGSDHVNQIGLETDEGSDCVKSRLRGELRAVSGCEEQVRPDEPVST